MIAAVCLSNSFLGVLGIVRASLGTGTSSLSFVGAREAERTEHVLGAVTVVALNTVLGYPLALEVGPVPWLGLAGAA